MRVLQTRGELNLQPEALSLDLGSQLARKNFHCDPPSENLVVGDEQPAHRPAMKLPLEGVCLPEGFSQRFKEFGQEIYSGMNRYSCVPTGNRESLNVIANVRSSPGLSRQSATATDVIGPSASPTENPHAAPQLVPWRNPRATVARFPPGDKRGAGITTPSTE